MKGIRKLTAALLLLFLSACHRDIPIPKSKLDFKTMSANEAVEDFPVSGKLTDSRFFVRHHVKGKNLFVECMLSDISFRDDHQNKKVGKIMVYVDGTKTQEIDSPVFIIKSLPSGSHTIILEVVNPQNQPYELKREFSVTIP